MHLIMLCNLDQAPSRLPQIVTFSIARLILLLSWIFAPLQQIVLPFTAPLFSVAGLPCSSSTAPEQERRRHPCNALLCRTLSSQSRQLHHGAILRRTECAARLQFAKCNTGNCGTHFFHCCAAVTSRKGAPHLKVLESWQKAAKKET